MNCKTLANYHFAHQRKRKSGDRDTNMVRDAAARHLIVGATDPAQAGSEVVAACRLRPESSCSTALV